MHVPPKLTLDDIARNQVRDIIDIIDITEKQNIHEVYIPPLNYLKTKWKPISWSPYFFKVCRRNEKGDCPSYCIFSYAVCKMVLRRV